MKLTIIFLFLLLAPPLFVSSQNPLTKADSLKTALANAKEDTTKINLLNALGRELAYQNPDTSILLGKQALEILTVIASEERAWQSPELSSPIQKLIANTNSNLGAYYDFKGDYPLSLSYHFKALEIRKQLNNKERIAVSLGNIGIVYFEQGDYPNALKYYFDALAIDKELGNKNGIARHLGNIGIVYFEQGDYPNALKHYFDALKIDKELGNKYGMAANLGNIGLVYNDQSDYPNALKHYFDALKIDKELGNKNGMAKRLGNIGIVYQEQSDYPNALKYHFEALKINKELGNKNGIADNLGNIGIVYDEQGYYPSALKHYFDALKIAKELGNKNGMAINLGNIGSLYTMQGRFKDAKDYLDSALAIFDTIGALCFIAESHQALSHLYDTTARYQLAYHHYKKYSVAKDSLFNEEKSKEIGRLEQKHEFEIAEMERKRVEEEVRRWESEARSRRNLLQYSGIVLGLIALFMGIFLFARRFKKTKENAIGRAAKSHLTGDHPKVGQSPEVSVIVSAAKQSPDKNIFSRLLQSFLLRNEVKIFEATLFISFFIFFEFILVFLDPYLEAITGGQPALKLLVNAVLAGVIFPMHSILEAKLKGSVLKSKVVSHKAGGGSSKTMLLLVGFAFISLFNVSFLDKTDSLKIAIGNAKEDTIKVKLLNDLGWELMSQNPDTSILLGKHSLEIAIKIGSKKGIANSNNSLGIYYNLKGDYPLSLSHHFKGLVIQKQINDKKGIASSLGNIGIVYKAQGEYLNALKHFFSSLEIYKELGNKKGMLRQLGNIGIIYLDQATVAKSRPDVAGIDSLYANALKHCFSALEIAKELGIKNGISIQLGNIGSAYHEQANLAKSRQDIAKSDSLYTKALKHFFEALEIDKELGRKSGIAIKLANIGSLYTETGRFKEAEAYLDSALAICDTIGALSYTMQCENLLSHLYDITARYQLAYTHYKKYSVAKDSLFNEEKSKVIGRLEQKHEFEIAEMDRKRIEEEKSRQEAEAASRRNLLQYSSIFLVLCFLFGVVFFLGKITLPEWMVELLTFVPFMILFEFILVLLEPYIENYTGGGPLYKLLVNAVCAMVLFPIHSFFEKKLKAHIFKIKRQKVKKYAEEFRREVDKLMS